LVEQIHVIYPDLPNARWVALRLLDGDEKIVQAFRKGDLGDLSHGAHPEDAERAMTIKLEAAS